MNGFSEYEVDIGETALCVRDGGTGPLVIFLHGITANRRVWDPVVDELEKSFRTVTVDQRGHGRSAAPSTGYEGSDFARDVADLVGALGEEKGIVVGHSLGARNALLAASEFPTRVRAVVAIEFAAYIESAILDALEERVIGGGRPFASTEEVELYLRKRYPRLPADAVSRRARFGYRHDGGSIYPLADPRAMEQTVHGLREDIAPALKAIRVPTLLVRGAESAFITAEAFAASAELRRDFPRLIVPDADHYVPEEAPRTVADAVHRFIHELSVTDTNEKPDEKEDRADTNDNLRPATR